MLWLLWCGRGISAAHSRGHCACGRATHGTHASYGTWRPRPWPVPPPRVPPLCAAPSPPPSPLELWPLPLQPFSSGELEPESLPFLPLASIAAAAAAAAAALFGLARLLCECEWRPWPYTAGIDTEVEHMAQLSIWHKGPRQRLALAFHLWRLPWHKMASPRSDRL